LGALLLFTMPAVRAQDIHFSQFFEAPLLRNPALAGIFTGDYRVQAIFHNQWNSFANAYRTGSLNGEYKWPVGKGSDYFTTGLQVLYDQAGTAALSTTEILPALNYHKSLSNNHPMYLSVGFMGGYVAKSLDLSKVTTNSQYNGTAFDPALPNGETILSPNIHYLDGSLGISFNTSFGNNNANTMFAGFSYQHLNRPKNSFYKNPTAQETIAGALYSYKLGDDPENSLYTLSLGGFLRWKDAFIPVLKLEMNGLAVALSYDVNVSQLKTASEGRGGFELSISYIGFLDRENAKFRILCPKF